MTTHEEPLPVQNSRLRWQLSAITFSRLIMNIGLRMVYPFLPTFARGLGVEVTAVSRLVGLRSLTGFVSPLFSPLSEKVGRKPVMIGAMLAMGVSSLLVFIWPFYTILGVSLALIALSKIVYDPAMQAHLGETVPYQQRGRAIAFTELAWSGAFLLGAPAVGFLIAQRGWSAPFLALGILSFVSIVWLWRVLPSPSHHLRANTQKPPVRLLTVLRQHPIIWAVAAYTLLVLASNETLFIVYGRWMEDAFHLSTTTLGLATGVIGMAELGGELFTSFAVDRWGKRWVVLLAGSLGVAVYLLIPILSTSRNSALAILFCTFFIFEITVVGVIPLFTELVPEARSVVMGMSVSGGALGRALGAWLGTAVWSRAGLFGNSLAAALLTATAVAVLWRWLKEQKQPIVLKEV